MIAKSDNFPDPAGDFDVREVENDDEGNVGTPSPSQPRPACTRCVLLGKPVACHPQTTQRRAQACELCHLQRQWCSWIGDHTFCQSWGKRAKVEDDIYWGPAVRITNQKFEGPGIAEQLAVLAGQNIELFGLVCRSLAVQKKMLGIMERRERRELGMVEEEKEDEEDEDEDGEGEEDEEEKERNDEEKKRKEVREGKKCTD
ncbi:hypothetical protein GGU11DRAFT_750955 [Lentinula aff. detonsa]|nr:hypothetical protein GGU11DRAFT_750955 [Lentinula aff. detonsa]